MIIRLFDKNPNPKQVQHIVECLRNGGVIIYPTDTVYGMGCDLTNSKAMARLARIKGKPDTDNMSLICHDLSHLSAYCKPLDNAVFRVLRKALPGPYTFILEASNLVPKLFSDKKKTVGIRVPDNSIIRAIVEELQHPIVSTTIDISEDGPEWTCDPDLIHEKYQKLVDIVIDGGYGQMELSTVIDCSNGEINVLREGKGSLDIL